MTHARRRSVIQLGFLFALVVTVTQSANAESRALDGKPVSIVKAQGWCIAPGTEIPSWESPANPECKMTWRVLSEGNGRLLYSARYAWPSPRRGGESWRVLTEVLFEGAKGSRVVRPVFGIQEDEARLLLAPLQIRTVGDKTMLEARVCLNGTTECGSEFAVWTTGRVDKFEDHIVAEIRAQLPKGYELTTNPQIDLAQLSGQGTAATKGDADCCPSATIAFKLRIEGTELHVEDMQFRRERSSQ